MTTGHAQLSTGKADDDPVVAGVPTALDFPDCAACQMWQDAGASWPRPCKQHYGGEPTPVSYVAEGWWHPNTKSGQVHDHPENPGASWSIANHRLCEQVYTRRVGNA